MTKDNSTVIITGAGSGIGLACVKRFYDNGYNIVLAGRTEDKLKQAASELADNRHLIVKCDVSNEDDVKNLINKTNDAFGAIDTVVNNAGFAVMKAIDELDVDEWKKVQEINSTGVFLVSKLAMPYLSKSKGSIVNVSSVSGLGGDWGGFAYNASKGAVSNFTRALALDYKQTKVRVNAVAPSFTDTAMAEGLKDNKKLYDRFMERIPMGRPAEPDDIAKVICFLASPDAGFVNGVILPVDGGLSASNGQPPLNMQG